MKKIILLLSITISLFSCKKGSGDTFLTGQIKGLGSSPVYLISGASNNATIDTLKVRKSAFILKDSPEEPQMFTLILPQNRSISFFGNESSHLTISGDINLPYSISIAGDSVNDKLTRFRKNSEVTELFNLQQKAESALLSDSLKRYEDLLYSSQAKSLKKTLKYKTEKFIAENVESPAAVLAIRDYLNLTDDYTSLKELFSKINGKVVKDFSLYQELKLASKLQLKKESTILSFQAYNLNNKQEYFYTATGKRMVLLFWKSEDKYSAYLNKKLSDNFEKANKDSINFTAISLDDSFEDWKTAVDKNIYKGKQLIARGGFQNENIRKFGISRTPLLLEINKAGSITAICENDANPLK